MPTLLAKKSGPQDNAIATDDEHHEALANDPTVSAFPQGSSFGSGGFNGGFNTTNGAPAFGAPQTGGFGGSGGFSSTTTTSSTVSSFGSGPAIQGAAATQHNPADLLKSGGGAMSEGGESTVALDKDATDWINKKWRPAMGWVYMATCTADFVLFPILWSMLQALTKGNVTMQWQP